jgi:hypothetical protein
VFSYRSLLTHVFTIKPDPEYAAASTPDKYDLHVETKKNAAPLN